MKIIVSSHDITCPCCGCKEVTDNTLPIEQWEWNIKAYRVESGGIWWSKCLHCNVYFTDDGYVEVNDDTSPAIRAEYGLDKTGVYHFEF